MVYISKYIVYCAYFVRICEDLLIHFSEVQTRGLFLFPANNDLFWKNKKAKHKEYDKLK